MVTTVAGYWMCTLTAWLVVTHSDTMRVIVAPRSGPVFKSSKKPRYGSIAAGDEYVANIYIFICIIFMLHIHTNIYIYTYIYIYTQFDVFLNKFQRFRQMLSRFGVDPMDDHCGPWSGFSFRRGERVKLWVSRGPHNVSHLTCPQWHWSHLRFWIFLWHIFCTFCVGWSLVGYDVRVMGQYLRDLLRVLYESSIWFHSPSSKAFLELSEDAEVALHWGSAPVAGEWQPIGRAWWHGVSLLEVGPK